MIRDIDEIKRRGLRYGALAGLCLMMSFGDVSCEHKILFFVYYGINFISSTIFLIAANYWYDRYKEVKRAKEQTKWKP
jgi:hypothetical protein